MSYSQEIKNELCLSKLHCNNCKKAMIYGLLLFNRGVNNELFSINTENKAVVDLLVESLIDDTQSIVTVIKPDIRKRTKRPIYTVTIEDQEEIQKVLLYYFDDNQVNKQNINNEIIEKECCKVAFLRGAYLTCGTMINPLKEYHFEFSVSNKKIASELLFLLTESGLDFHITSRGKSFILYTKESQQIEDILTYLGAFKSSLNLMNLKIEKELRNNANRVTNCETANISKTVNAAQEQIEKIKYIKETIGFDELPQELQDIAILRLINPEASLRELCELNGNKLSRSGLNHRLKKLISIADELKNN